MPQISQYWRSVAAVLSGAATAQAIPIVASLLLTRLFAPESFGVYATWLGLVSILSIVLTARFELVLAIEAEGAPRQASMFWSVLTLLLTTTAAMLTLAIVLILFGARFGSLQPLAWMLLPAAGATAALQIWLSWAAAEGDLRNLSLFRISQTGSVVTLQLLFGMFSNTALILALAHVLGLCLTVVLAARRMPLSLPARPWRSSLLDFWRRQRRFPAYSLPADTMNMASAQLPLLIVASRFGPETAGFLALTIRTMGVAFGMSGMAVLDVFKRAAAGSYRQFGNCRDDYLRTFRVLAVGSLIACCLLVWVAPDLFALLFGEQWRQAGQIALWMLPLYALRLVASPLSYTFYIAGKQNVDLVWQFGLLVLTLLTLHIPTTAASALQLYSAGYSLMYAVYLVLSYRFSLGTSR